MLKAKYSGDPKTGNIRKPDHSITKPRSTIWKLDTSGFRIPTVFCYIFEPVGGFVIAAHQEHGHEATLVASSVPGTQDHLKETKEFKNVRACYKKTCEFGNIILKV